MTKSNAMTRYLAFARHTAPNQFIARLGLMAKRKAYCKLLAGVRAPALHDKSVLVSLEPPTPLFKAKANAEKSGVGVFTLRFLNESRDFTLPFSWHLPELDTGTRLWKLNLHYHEFLRALGPEDARDVMLDWINQNNTYRDTYWMDSWNSYALSIRVVSWMEILTENNWLLPENDINIIRRSLIRQLLFLEKNIESDILGNHVVKNIKALFWASAYFNGPLVRRWRNLGSKLLQRELGVQVLADGVHFERSPSYHAQVFADLLAIYAVRPRDGLTEGLEDALDRMAQALADLTHPDGCPAQFGDAGLTMCAPAHECLDAYARLRSRPAPAPRESFALPDGGFYGARRGDDYCVVKMGALGPDTLMAHAHGDWGGFEWSLGGQRVFVDQGVYEYAEGEKRAVSRSTARHNTATLDGAEQADFFGAFRCGVRPRPAEPVFAAHPDGFDLEGRLRPAMLVGGGVHARRLNLRGRTLRIEDWGEGAASGALIVSRLLLHPDMEIIAMDGTCASLRGPNGLALEVRADDAAQLTVEDAEWWPDMGAALPSRRLAATGGGRVRLEINGAG